MNLSPQEHQTITQLTQGIGAGIGGLIEMALANDGPGAAAASLAAVKAGRAHVEVTVLITRIGVSAEGHMCSHGKKSHLFSVNLDQPPGSDGGASAQATH